MNINYQSWKAYAECPKKYFLRHVEKKPPLVPINDYYRLYGILVQQFFQMFCNIWRFKIPYMPIEEVRFKMNVLYKNLLAVSQVTWPQSGPGQDEILEQACLDTFAVMDGQNQNYFLNTQSEVDISVTISSDVNINCRVDFIHKDALDEKSILIFDGKGTDKIGKNIDKNQLYFYTLLYHKHTGIMPAGIGIFYYRFNTYSPIPLDGKIMDSFQTKLSQDVTNMMSAPIIATPCSKSCKYCEYRPGCPESTQYFAKRAKPSKLDIPDGVTEFSF